MGGDGTGMDSAGRAARMAGTARRSRSSRRRRRRFRCPMGAPSGLQGTARASTAHRAASRGMVATGGSRHGTLPSAGHCPSTARASTRTSGPAPTTGSSGCRCRRRPHLRLRLRAGRLASSRPRLAAAVVVASRPLPQVRSEPGPVSAPPTSGCSSSSLRSVASSDCCSTHGARAAQRARAPPGAAGNRCSTRIRVALRPARRCRHLPSRALQARSLSTRRAPRRTTRHPRYPQRTA